MYRKLAALIAIVAAVAVGYVTWAHSQMPDLAGTAVEVQELCEELAEQTFGGDATLYAQTLGDPCVCSWSGVETGHARTVLMGAAEREAVAAGREPFAPGPGVQMVLERVDVQMLGPAAAMATIWITTPIFPEPIAGVGLMLTSRRGEWKITAITLPGN